MFTVSSCKKDVSNVAGTNATETTNSATATTSTNASTILYISGTMHIESQINKWPNIDSLKKFFATATQIGKLSNQSTGMKWSIGADIGWLKNEPRAAEVIAYTEALGIEWDIHAHNMSDRPLCGQKITALGGHPNAVCSGFQASQIDSLKNTIANGTARFTAQVLWGLTNDPSHNNGSEDYSAGLWIPKSSANYTTHDPTGKLINVGGYTRKIIDAENLAKDVSTHTYSYPVTSATIMVDPVTLTTPNTTDGISAITAFANRVGSYSCVKWASISKTAEAWKTAGSINSKR